MKNLSFRLPENMSPQARSAFLFATILAIAHIAAAPYYVYLGNATKFYQFSALAGISLLLGLLLAAGAVLSWRGHPTAGIVLVLGSMAVSYPLFAVMVTGLGLVLGIAMMIVGTMSALQVLQHRLGRAMAVLTVIAGITTVVLDANGPTTRPVLPGVFIQLLALAVVGMLGVFLIREFPRVRTSVSYKLISVVVMVWIISAGFQILYSNWVTRQNLEKESRDTLVGYYHTYEDKIQTESVAAEALALSIANREDVQALYQSKDRDGLYNLLSPLFAQWKDRQIVHLYIESPDGTVFLRVHDPKSFDDNITYRDTASTALKEKRVTAGVEVGPSRLGVRGVAPMYSSTGQFIGLAEVGMDFDEQFITGLKQYTGADYTMWILREAAAAPNLQPVKGAPAAPTDEVFYYASSSSEFPSVNSDVYHSVLETGQPVFQVVTQNTKTPSIVYITPLLGYGNKVIGLLQISEPYTGHLADQRSAFLTTLAVTAILTILGLLLIALFSSRVVIQPLNELSHFATRQMSGETSSRVSVTSGDEFQQLADTFNLLANSVEQERTTLENRVADRTRNLELATEVGRAVSQVRDLNVMLKDACELILKEFDLYYVQVYLADPSQATLKLEAGTGTVGAQLLGRGHSLPLDSHSINGRAALDKHTVVIADTAQSAAFRKNPLLPGTRGEMAVPLILADKVVGVLDMQSNQPGVLTEEALPAFEALAGQLAVAIQNASLLAEAEEARAEVEKQARRLVRAGWSEHLDAIHKPEQLGFVFDHNQIAPLAEAAESRLSENGKAFSAPISVTGEALGSLLVEFEADAQNDQTNELVTTVARQVAQHIENLRLLEGAERYRYEAEQAARLQTLEGWQNYMASRSENLGYLYDTKEVRPHSDENNNEEMFALPLKARDEMIGKLGVEGLSNNDQESVELVSAVAERLSAHIENLRLYDQTQSALTQSEKLFDASRRLTQAAGLQELMTATVTSMGISEVNRALLTNFNYDENGDIEELTIIGNWWNGTGHDVTPTGTRYPLEVIRAMTMFVSPVPVFFSDTLHDNRVDATTLQLVKRLNLRAVAVLPLHLGARQIGALILEAEEPHNFTQDEIRLFSSLAPQIATIVQNQRQFEKAQKQAEREAMLNVINQKIQSATSVEAVLQIAARELGHALGAPMTIAQLSMKDKSW